MWAPDRTSSRPPRSTRSYQGPGASSVSSLDGRSYNSNPQYVPNSTSSLQSGSFQTAYADGDDDSSCDDTYVSMTPNRASNINKESLFEESPRILRGTTLPTNVHSRPPSSTRSSPGLPRKKDFSGSRDRSSGHSTISRTETNGILDKLKNDINSLDIIRNASYVEDMSTVYSASVFDFEDENENKSIASNMSKKSIRSSKNTSHPKVIRGGGSSDRSYRREELLRSTSLVVDTELQDRHHASSAASVDGSRSIDAIREKHKKKIEMHPKPPVMDVDFKSKSVIDRSRSFNSDRQKDEQISKLHETIRGLKKEVLTGIEEKEHYTSEVSVLKSKLQECQVREEDAQKTLREVMKNVERERRVREQEMQYAGEKDHEKISRLQDTILELKRDAVVKRDEIERTIRELKTEALAGKEEAERHSNTILELKSQLERCKTKEEETQTALREVMKNVEHERDVRAKEMELASKVQGAEVLVLEEKLDELRKERSTKSDALRTELSEKNNIIDALKRDVNQLRSKLDDSTRSKADSEKTLRSQVERLELRLDSETETHRKTVAELNDEHQRAEEEWAEKLKQMETSLEEQRGREVEWVDELSGTKLELENLRSFAAALENQNDYLKESNAGLQKLELEHEELTRITSEMKLNQVESDRTIDDLTKELEVAHRAKATLAQQVETMKKSELERDGYISRMVDSLGELEKERREHRVKIDKLQNELAKCEKKKAALENSEEAATEANTQLQEVTAKLKTTMEEYDETRAELKKSNAHLQDMSSKLERSINEGRELTEQIGVLKSENLKLTSGMADRERDLRDKSVKISELQSQVELYKDQGAKFSTLESTNRDMKLALDESQSKQSELELKLKKANEKLDELESNYDRLEAKNKALRQEQIELEEREKSYSSNATKREREQIDTIHKLRTEKNEQSDHIERLKEEVAKALKDLSQANKETKKVKDQLRTAMQSLDETMKYIDDMKEESDEMIKALEVETDSLMKRIGVLEKHREFDQQTIKLCEEEKNERIKQAKAECEQKIQEVHSGHAEEIKDVKLKYECRIKELQSSLSQRSEVTKCLQERGNSEVSNLIKKVGEITEKHSTDLRALRDKYEAELSEEIKSKDALQLTLRELESKNEELEDALKLAKGNSSRSSPSSCANCDSISKTLKEKEEECNGLRTKVQDQTKVRSELAQCKQLVTITQANEKLLEDHVASLEAQIDSLVAEYESRLDDAVGSC